MKLSLSIPAETMYMLYSTVGIVIDSINILLEESTVSDPILFKRILYVTMESTDSRLNKIENLAIQQMNRETVPFVYNSYHVYLWKIYRLKDGANQPQVKAAIPYGLLKELNHEA